MRGQRLYKFEITLKSGEVIEANFTSSSKKGSIENYLDAVYAAKKIFDIKIDDIVQGGVVIGYAQTSLSRR